jgi:hypothetical protein
MLVAQRVSAAQLASDLDQALVVPAPQRVVLFEYKHRRTRGSRIADEGM